MKIVSVFIWSALEICFAHLFLSSFLESTRSKKDTIWLLLGAWGVNAAFSFFISDGIYNYLIYLFVTVLLLLCIYDEYGAKGLCLLAFSFIIPFVLDISAYHFTEDTDDILYYGIMTLGKVFAILFAYVLRRCRKANNKNSISEDSEALLLRQHMEMQQESMNALEQNYRLQRKSTHEFEHHLQVLRDLLAGDEIEAAKDYLHRLKKNRSIHTISVSSGHPVVDVILNQKYQAARQNEIKMQV